MPYWVMTLIHSVRLRAASSVHALDYLMASELSRWVLVTEMMWVCGSERTWVLVLVGLLERRSALVLVNKCRHDWLVH